MRLLRWCQTEGTTRRVSHIWESVSGQLNYIALIFSLKIRCLKTVHKQLTTKMVRKELVFRTNKNPQEVSVISFFLLFSLYALVRYLFTKINEWSALHKNWMNEMWNCYNTFVCVLCVIMISILKFLELCKIYALDHNLIALDFPLQNKEIIQKCHTYTTGMSDCQLMNHS